MAPTEDSTPVPFASRLPRSLKLELEDVLHQRKRAGLEPWTITDAISEAIAQWVARNKVK